MTRRRVDVDRMRRQLERSSGVWTEAEVNEIKWQAAELAERIAKYFPEPCKPCNGTGRCSDMACWCLTDRCHHCKGTGSS